METTDKENLTEKQKSWGAFQERISEPTKFTVLSEEEKEELVKKGILNKKYINNTQ